MIDLRQLRAFIAVAETEHVGRAAERLHISQSPLSRQIIRLEEQLGLALFERVRQRVRLTKEGQIFLEEARSLLKQAERLETHAQRLARGETGTLSIGYVEASMRLNLLPQALQSFCATYPDVPVTLHALRSAKQIDAIRKRTLDIGLVYSPPSPADTDLASLLVASDSIVLAIPDDHPLGRVKRITARHLDGQRWIAMPRALNPAARERFVAACSACGFMPDIRLEAVEPTAMLRLVGAGLGVGLVQAALRTAASPGILFKTLPWFPLTVDVHVVWRRWDCSPLLARFLENIASLSVEDNRR
ncbi:hypothetical protein WS67_09350 [Burkholderia singularis]|uniref:HTH lysR-type domain-containing protein n=1 Tax=Burkholderia singularis TaxID=1503053 RepID=A0A103E5Q6_9BURK|nr:LysR substrate-binding domain-containing protein [Burkholderia singularis]KVE28886.1 hypothetical protein WS67_09350 [Burkholderia singularis]